ncbi:hypothetical protein GV828_01320 [Flavobacterium sp. NST-5]|uniref:RDD domain-containing protein n=1 Tax=Flavobacterium ichthyis TaxID=2698827 RepID=A0ABW9Z4S2_9FLAO|nr:RDD family protein [Flavobacterium ichthyis]NBL63833.1 hypothetical protein [Flavobacterium ichthyis]
MNFFILLIQLLFSYEILKFLQSSKTLNTQLTKYGNTETSVLIETSKFTRFFHHVMDTFTILLIFSAVIMGLVNIPFIKDFLNSWSNRIGEQAVIFIIVVFFRVFYYLTLEAILGVTPAKLLSETRVVDQQGAKPSTNKIISRTLLRLVPFEAFSFFMHSGLHDKTSGTYVVNEKRTGVKGSLYFLMIPVSLILGFALWYGVETYNQVKADRQFALEEKLKNEIFLEKLKNISTHDVLILKAINYDHDAIFLKTEIIENEAITFVILDTEKDYRPYFGEFYNSRQAENVVEKIYEIEKQNPETVKITKKNILKANETIGNENFQYKKGLTIFGKQFEITEIKTYFEPRFNVYHSQSGDNSFVGIQNEGWPATLIAVTKFTPKDGNLPIQMTKNDNSITLIGTKTDTFDFQIKVKDSLNRIFSYKISKKKDLNPIIKKIK